MFFAFECPNFILFNSRNAFDLILFFKIFLYFFFDNAFICVSLKFNFIFALLLVTVKTQSFLSGFLFCASYKQ